ncbi:MAG: hypothetical protein PHH54_00545 [Candidatus Nanoarchaeia archaeon]|nr:hypothetical protein [Candidatus Nanoarchaeia archaeon]MDD5740451.1 hypothetical protein [Candidatus Nanoarchaeia archaeon]
MEATIKDTKQVLLVGEILENAYKKLGERNSNREIILPEEVRSEIADDSDYHKIRTGYMGYKTVTFFNFNNKSWLIGNGKSCGAYPARPYDSDILALELDIAVFPERVRSEFQENVGSYFKNSLMYCMTDGMLAISKHGKFNKSMMNLLRPRIEEFIAEEPKYNEEIISPDTHMPVNISPMKYKPEFADFLAESIEAVLKQS